jgi:hypothetical protein
VGTLFYKKFIGGKMCRENKIYFLMLLAGLLLSCVVGVLRGEELHPWYLISETELQRFETALQIWEQDRQTWQLQASVLKAESRSLNEQLREEREITTALRKSYETSEAEKLTLISSKNGEIAALEQEKADEALKAETYKGKAALRMVIIISMLTAIAGYIVFKVLRFLRIIPI